MEGLDLLKIGEAIKIRRIKRRIHQTKLAEQLGISQTHLSNIENGRVGVTLLHLIKIKELFECPIEYFFEEKTLDELVDPENYDELGKKKEKVKRYKLVRCSE